MGFPLEKDSIFSGTDFLLWRFIKIYRQLQLKPSETAAAHPAASRRGIQGAAA